MSFAGWVKRKPNNASSVGISSVRANQKEINTISFVFTLTDSSTLETNTIMLPPGPSISVKDVKVLQKNKDQMSFEITFSDDAKVVTDTFSFMPTNRLSTEITTLVANPENILFATSSGLDYGVNKRIYMYIPWNRRIILTTNAVELNENKDEIIIKKSGTLSVVVMLFLKVKVPQDVKTIQLKIMKRAGHVLGMTIITLPSGKIGENLSFNAGSYRFTNLQVVEGQSVSVMLQCWTGDQIHMGVDALISLEVMWFPTADH